MSLMLLECQFCKKSFERPKGTVIYCRKIGKSLKNFCGHRCHYNFRKSTSHVLCKCANCNHAFNKRISSKASKSGNYFCSKSCAAIYNNKHKTHGFRRSKLECYLEQELNKLLPNVNILFNNKQAINSELDIYFPDIKLAFELNGIFHYKSIYGEDKLKSIQLNDQYKIQKCLELGIDLEIIDVSNIGKFTKKDSIQFVNLIVTKATNLLKNRRQGLEP